MADHVRKQLRDAVVAAVTGLATTGANVFVARVLTLVDSELPALQVFVQSETAEILTVHNPAVLDRTVQFDVVGTAKASSNLDDTLDQIAKEVEIALAALDVSGTQIQYTGCDIEFDAKAEKPVGSVTLHYQAEIFSLANAPDVLV